MKILSSFLAIALIGFTACKNEAGTLISNFNLGDTVIIKVHETLINEENKISLRMDSVLEDSRCPIGGQCIWAGNGEARFVFKSYNQEIKFKLNTLLHPRDTILSGYKITLIDLLPHPVVSHSIDFSKYYANITIQKN